MSGRLRRQNGLDRPHPRRIERPTRVRDVRLGKRRAHADVIHQHLPSAPRVREKPPESKHLPLTCLRVAHHLLRARPSREEASTATVRRGPTCVMNWIWLRNSCMRARENSSALYDTRIFSGKMRLASAFCSIKTLQSQLPTLQIARARQPHRARPRIDTYASSVSRVTSTMLKKRTWHSDESRSGVRNASISAAKSTSCCSANLRPCQQRSARPCDGAHLLLLLHCTDTASSRNQDGRRRLAHLPR